MMKRYLLAILPLLLSSMALAAQSKLFSADDVFELEYANDPRISPDGSQIVYERRSNDIMADETRSNLWLIDTDGRRQRPLVSATRSASSPRWSADGGRIAYLRSTDTGSGIFVRWMDTGVTALVANLQEAPADLSWSPDGRWLAFVMPVPKKTEPIAKSREKPAGATWSEPVKVIESPHYRRDGQGFLEPAYKHIFVVPADGGTPRQLTSGDFDHGGRLSWTHDGSSIVFSANRHDGWELESGESDIFSVAVDDGTLIQVTTRQGGEESPVVSPNGRYIAYLSNANRMVPYNGRVVHVMNVDGSDDQALTADLD